MRNFFSWEYSSILMAALDHVLLKSYLVCLSSGILTRAECNNTYPQNGKLICCTQFFQYDGECRECPLGFFGDNCSSQCDYPLYGRLCQSICQCDINTCDPVMGCTSSTSTEVAATEILPNEISSQDSTMNKTNETVTNAAKECLIGSNGKECSTHCPYPSYGDQCKNECKCSIDRCDPVHGCIELAITEKDKGELFQDGPDF